MTREQRQRGWTSVVHRLATDEDALRINVRRDPARVYIVRLRAGSIQSRVLAAVERRGATCAGEVLAALPDIRRQSIDCALSGLVALGHIRRVAHGIYGPATGFVRALPSGGLSLVDGTVAVIVPAAVVGHIREFLGSEERGERDR